MSLTINRCWDSPVQALSVRAGIARESLRTTHNTVIDYGDVRVLVFALIKHLSAQLIQRIDVGKAGLVDPEGTGR